MAITFASAAKSGAAYAYSKAAFGSSVGQYVGITRVMAESIAWGTMGTFVIRTTLNIFGTKILTLTANISTVGKVSALIITIIAGKNIF